MSDDTTGVVVNDNGSERYESLEANKTGITDDGDTTERVDYKKHLKTIVGIVSLIATAVLSQYNSNFVLLYAGCLGIYVLLNSMHKKAEKERRIMP